MAVILAIDEDVVLTMSLDLQLGHVGHTVQRANTITVALSHYSQTTPTVVVIDPSLEEQNGWQLVTKWVATVPIVIISHDPTDATRQRAESLGCAVVLTKPFLMRDLVNVLTPFLEGNASNKKPPRKRATASQPIVEGDSKTVRTPRKRTQRTEPQPVVPSLPTPREDTLGIGISDADEQLLAGLPTTAPNSTASTPRQETLGMRMRNERLKRNIPLSQIDLIIGVHMAHVQAMEEDRFSYLPRGRMAEEIITKYVRYLGMDVNEALNHYRNFKYAEQVEPIVSYGAENLKLASYGWVLQLILALVVLGLIGWGIYRVDRARVMQYAGGMIEVVFPPTATPTATHTATASITPSYTATITPSATATWTLTPSDTATVTPTPTRTPRPSRTFTPTRTLRPSRTFTRTRTPRPSRTFTRTRTPRVSATQTASSTTTASNTVQITASASATASRTPLGARTSPTVRNATATATKRP